MRVVFDERESREYFLVYWTLADPLDLSGCEAHVRALCEKPLEVREPYFLDTGKAIGFSPSRSSLWLRPGSGAILRRYATAPSVKAVYDAWRPGRRVELVLERVAADSGGTLKRWAREGVLSEALLSRDERQALERLGLRVRWQGMPYRGDVRLDRERRGATWISIGGTPPAERKDGTSGRAVVLDDGDRDERVARFRFVQCSDHDGVKRALQRPEALALGPTEWVVPSALAGALTGRVPLVRLVGRHGAGKSVALALLAMALPDGVMVVIDPDATETDLATIEGMLRAVAQEKVDTVFFVVDDVHLAVGPFLVSGILGMRGRLERFRYPFRRIRTAVGVLSREEDRVVRDLLPVLEGFGQNQDVISLDGSQAAFLVEVAEAAKTSRHRNYSFGGVREAVMAWPTSALTPGSIVNDIVCWGSYWEESGLPARFTAAVEDDWNVRARLRGLSPSALALLRSLGLLLRLDLGLPEREAVFEVATDLFGADPSTLEPTLEELVLASWLSVDGTLLVSDRARCNTDVFGLSRSGLFVGDWVSRFVEMLVRRQGEAAVAGTDEAYLALLDHILRWCHPSEEGPILTLARGMAAVDVRSDALREVLGYAVSGGAIPMCRVLHDAYEERGPLLREVFTAARAKAVGWLAEPNDGHEEPPWHADVRTVLAYFDQQGW